MSEELLQHALKVFAQQALARMPPSLALLGPPGSGKSIFLKKLMNSCKLREGPFANTRGLMLDLRNIPIESELEIYSFINQALLQEVVRTGITQKLNIPARISHPLRFEEILRALLRAVNDEAANSHLVIFIDHLESVPRLFASDLNHRFRNFLETTDENSVESRLGLVIAGVISLYDLKHGPNSAFQMHEVIRFPRPDQTTRVQLVEEYLKNYESTAIPSEVLTLLADLTGGEPGFLEPLIPDLLKDKQVPVTREVVLASVQQLCAHSNSQVLRNLALHLWTDDGLRGVVRELAESMAVMPRSAAPDIDRYELAGAVVIGAAPYGNAREYKFRNEITKLFLTEVSAVLATNGCGPQAQSISIEKDLRELDAARKECLNATEIWTWMKAVQDAWLATTRFNRPRLYLYVTKLGSSSGWWLDAYAGRIGDAELRDSSDLSTKTTTFRALDQLSVALSGDTDTIKGFIDSDLEHISIAMPLYARDIAFIITATVSRSDAWRGFTEFDLCHWLRFVQNVKHVVPNLVLAELCQNLLQQQKLEESQPAAIERLKTKRIYLLPEGDAIVDQAGRVCHISGKIRDVEDLNRRCLELIDEYTDLQRFQQGVQGIASQLETSLEARFRDLAAVLAPKDDVMQTVIASNAEGLKVPFELFPHANSHLSLLTGVSRQIIDHQLRPDVCFTFDELLRSLVRQKQELRVLLVSSWMDETNSGSEELEKVRNHIAAGCANVNLRPRFVELPPAEATVQRLAQELMESGQYHIFHYTGHGRHPTEDPDASGIVLQGSNGAAEVVKCARLRSWFSAARSWLVYLSCCNSSASSSSGSLSAKYVGMMDALVTAGVPNVVGFRCLVSDQAALHLADQFYRQLFIIQREKNLNLAMLAARRNVESHPDFFDAWASSMLITQYL